MFPVIQDAHPFVPPAGDSSSIMRSLAFRVEQLAELVPIDRPVVYLDYPVHLNIGDLLIEAGTEQFFTRFGYEIAEKRSVYDFGALARHWMPKDSTILLHGGGNFGDLYPLHQKFRERVIADYPEHRIVMLPQSLHFDSPAALAACAENFSRHGDLHICLRDEPSIETVRQHFRNPAYLVPDMAHLLWEPLEQDRAKPRGEATLLFARRDKESSAIALPRELSSQPGMDWNDLIGVENKAAYYALALLHRNRGASGGKLSLHPAWRILRNRLIAKSVRFLGGYDAVVTNRLHMGLLSLLLGRKVTLADNSYGKLTRYHAAWLSGIADAQVSS